jgi:uncharacterized protein YceH (UPF0502 family)
MMDILLNEIEIRILGCLVEKEMTTPEYYPLTLNSLINACNQKSNRSPVVSFDESTVLEGLAGLRDKQLVIRIRMVGGRTPKYEHFLKKSLNLSPPELAVLSELMLRGPQTVGELRNRTERMHPIKTLQEMEQIIQTLEKPPQPLVVRLPKQAGRKEHRYMHLFSAAREPNEESYSAPADENSSRMERLEEEVATLRTEVDALRAALERIEAGLK